jgi:hypothetical protein
MSMRRRSIRGSAGFAAAGLLALAAAGCSQAGAPSPVPTAVAAPVTPAPTPTGGPAAYADWVTRQGFGGSSGLNEVKKVAKYLSDHVADATAFDLTDNQRDIRALEGWLDSHPATACWTAYHDAIRADLKKLDALYDTALAAVATGGVTVDTATAIADLASTAAQRPDPANCP